MPLPESHIENASPRVLAAYVPQLYRLGLNARDTEFIQYAIIDPSSFLRTGSDVERLRGIVYTHRQHLHYDPIAEGRDRDERLERLRAIHSSREHWVRTQGVWIEEGTDRYGEVIAPDALPLGIIDSVEIHHTERPRAQRKKKSWELSFMDEAVDRSEPTSSQYKREDEREPELVGNLARPLKEIAAILPPGILGMQFDGNGSPYNLVFRPEREDDPRRRLLKGHGWFEVKGHSAVLWSAATLEAYNILYDTGLEYKVSPKVKRWHDYITSNDMLPGLRFPEDCPLFDYQKEAVQFLARRKRGMLSLSPGLGKTLTSAYAASLMGYVDRVLLVCPASLLHYWHSELTKWSSKLPRKPMPEIWHKETGMQPQSFPLPDNAQFWAITNPETVTRFTDEFLDDKRWELMIVDESIMYKHRESKRSEALRKMAKAIPDVWLLTGAPATRYLDDMWHQFHILNDRGYASYWRFAEKYCVVEETVWAKSVLANKRNAEEEIKENFKDVYFARSQEQVADIPDWLMEDLDIPMHPKQEKLYTKLQEELEIEIGDRDDSEIITIDNRFGLILRSLQIASNPVLLGADNVSGKWSALPELMDIYPGPYLVWVNFIRTGEMLQEALRQRFGDNRVFMANGSTPMAERQSLVDKFQDGRMDALVLNSTVGKFGFTLTKARTSFFVERGYDDSYFQCLYRNRRIGTTQSPVVVNMRSVTQSGARTIDHVVHDALDYRNSMIKKITIGDLRGILHE